MQIFTENFDFGAISDFQDFQQDAFWMPFSAKRAPDEHDPELPRASQARKGSDSVSKSIQMVKIWPKRPKEFTKINQTASKNQYFWHVFRF